MRNPCKREPAVDGDGRGRHHPIFHGDFGMLGDVNVYPLNVGMFVPHPLKKPCDQPLGRLALGSARGREEFYQNHPSTPF